MLAAAAGATALRAAIARAAAAEDEHDAASPNKSDITLKKGTVKSLFCLHLIACVFAGVPTFFCAIEEHALRWPFSYTSSHVPLPTDDHISV
jgi:hypothetical protein